MNVVITGSTSGIGLEIAKKFLKEGHTVVTNGLCPDEKSFLNSLSEISSNVYFSPANLMTENGVKELIHFSREQLKGIDVLINCAGKQFVSPIENFPTNEYLNIMNLNLHSVFYSIREVMDTMKKNKFGRIINIASVHGLVASEYKSAYVASKHAVIGLTKTIALEGAPFGITCNAICPGYVKTPLVDGQIKDQAKAHNLSEAEVISKVLLAKHVIKDFISMDAISNLCYFLSSKEASTISGSEFVLDGGWTAQ